MNTNKFLLYLELIRIEFIRMLAYRSTYLTGIFNYAIQIGAYYFLWEAIYINRKSLAGLQKEQMLTYVIIAWVVRSFYFNNLDQKITKEILDGSVAVELIRPYRYDAVKLARSLGEALFRLFFFSLPSGLFIYLLRPFSLPQSWATWGIFAAAMFGSYLINAQIALLFGYSAFFTHSTSGVLRAKRVVTDLLSGLILPISFYPDWAQKALAYLPFQTISYLPNLIFLERLQGLAALKILVLQAFWVVVLYILNRIVWRIAIGHVVVHGG